MFQSLQNSRKHAYFLDYILPELSGQLLGLLHGCCTRYLNCTPHKSLERSPYFGVMRQKEKRVRSLLSLGLP